MSGMLTFICTTTRHKLLYFAYKNPVKLCISDICPLFFYILPDYLKIQTVEVVLWQWLHICLYIW